jgi:hypothetical protein
MLHAVEQFNQLHQQSHNPTIPTPTASPSLTANCVQDNLQLASQLFPDKPPRGPPIPLSTPRKINLTMTRPTASTLYNLILPTIFLNPVLFLHSLNTILTKLLPTMNGHEGNSAQPHLDIHASESLCWGYTALIVWAQMAAFLRFDRLREEQEKARLRKGGQQKQKREDQGYG